MSTLFMIGNGFDINCGMETSYTDVYKNYIKEPSNSQVIKEFKDSISADFETWGDFEIAMGEYAQNLQNEAEFLECIRDFARYMEQHLIKENNKIKQLLSEKETMDVVVMEMRQSFRNFYTKISHNIDVTMERRNATFLANFSAISFNYTDVFDVLWKKVLEQNNNNESVIHIHGLLKDDPVFGVDNISQIKANYELTRKGKRGFIKPIFNSEYDEYRVINAKKKIENAMTICTYGMSLGDSDLSWRNEIIEWLRADKRHHLFVYKYSFSDLKFFTTTEKLDIEDDAKEQLLSEWGIDDDELLYQIHIPCGKNIFNVEMVVKAALYNKNERKKAELKKKIEQGEKFIKQHEQEVVLT